MCDLGHGGSARGLGNLRFMNFSSQNSPSNVVAFPIQRRSLSRTCPECGTLSGTLRFGRILWGYCEDHETRWVATDFGKIAEPFDRAQLRRSLNFLTDFVEVSQPR